ncbi:MAG: hypothetical protein IJP89_02590 [Synergistaceae bacterium]|nr:hypothetical protein [Synergistaceae bacterium]
MPDFTPGNWLVEVPCLEHPYTAISDGNSPICMMCRRNSMTEKNANAMLISQAPEMFEILEQINAGNLCKDKAMKKKIRTVLERIESLKED